MNHGAGAGSRVIRCHNQEQVLINNDFIQGVVECPVKRFDYRLLMHRIFGVGGFIRCLGVDVNKIKVSGLPGQLQPVAQVIFRVRILRHPVIFHPQQ